jgi:hypothetical protein
MSEVLKKPTAYENYLYRQVCRVSNDPKLANEYLPEEILSQMLILDCSGGNDQAFELVGEVKKDDWDKDVFIQAAKNILDKFKIDNL